MKPLEIAVVITCYDLGRTLVEALDSVRGQTRKAAECVLVDDGSTDVHTRQTLARLESAGVRIIRTPNRGPAAARNTGIQQTTSPYVVLLDADDVLESRYLELAAARLDADPGLAFVSCGMRSFGESSEVWIPPTPDLLRSLSGEVVHVSSMFRREVWDAVGGFDETLRGHEDMDFWVTALERGFVGDVIAEPLLRYRVRSGSVSRRAIVHDSHINLMSRIYEKHRHSLLDQTEALVVHKERFILDQETHGQHLREIVVALETERDALDAEIVAATTELERSGVQPVDLADLRRTTPISDAWGTDRGLPLDRYYIEAFLDRHRQDIHGHVLEIKDAGYTRCFGDTRVTRSDVLDVDDTNEQATIVADLAAADGIPDNSFDCFILTQTLGLVYEVAAAVAESYRILKPGGVLLCTVPAAGRLSYEDRHLDSDFWRFTEASIRRIFAETFPIETFDVTGHGNVLACAAFLYGLAEHEISHAELDIVDPFFPLVYTIRATKPLVANGSNKDTRVLSPFPSVATSSKSLLAPDSKAAILMYHRVADDDDADPTICLPSAVFRTHMQHLRDTGLSVIPLSAMRRKLTEGGVNDRCIALTFDDGYLEMLSTVAPILKEYGFPFTAFVVGQALTRPTEFWWDTLRRVLRSGSPLPATLTVDLPNGRMELWTGTGADREAACARLTEAMYQLPLADQQAVVTCLLDWSGAARLPADAARPMNADELIELSKWDGAEIGAHTEDHVWLPAETPAHQRVQIAATSGRITALLGRSATAFAYPYGVWNDSLVEMAAQAGFREAVTTEERGLRAGDHPLLLPRIDVGGCSATDFASRIRHHL